MSETIQKTLSNQHVLAQCIIKIDGTNAPEEVMNHLLAVEIQQSLYLPAMFAIKFHNPNLGASDAEIFKIGSEVSIKMSQDKDGVPILTGEVTSLEFDAAPHGTPSITVRGYDRLHRLQRGRKTRTFTQVKDSDLVTILAKEGGMQGNTKPTAEVYDYVVQNNETNLEFLQRRIHRLGLELLAEDKTLLLRERQKGENSTTLEWGANLIRFISRMSTTYQVDEVIVMGWDPKSKKSIVGISNSSTNQPEIGEKKNGKEVASIFGPAKIASVYRNVKSQQEAEKVAKALFDDLAGRYIQVEGSCVGDPHLIPGKPVEINNIGQKLSGKYYVTSTVHHYTLNGYETNFQAAGKQTNTLLELVSQSSDRAIGQTMPGLVIGIVTNNNDPEKRGRVKIKFPWLPQYNDNDIESTWARVVTPMSGTEYGFYFLPEMNDEVLVGFEQGDIQRPYVLGSLWNGVDLPPKPNDKVISGGKVNERILKTRSGHSIIFNDSDNEPKVSIIDKTGKNKIELDSKTNKILIESGGNKIELDSKTNKISIESGGTGGLELKATNGKLSLNANEIEIKSNISTNLDGGGRTIIKGGMLELNPKSP